MNGPDIHDQDCLNDIREYWGVPTPSFLLETNASNTHRDGIISEENAPVILHEIFKHEAGEGGGIGITETTRSCYKSDIDLNLSTLYENQHEMDDAETGNIRSNKSLGVHLEQKLDWMSEYKHGEKVVEKDWVWINRYLQRKIIHSLSSILSACDMSNAWILCQGPPSTNEKTLEAAIKMTGSTPPTILVVDGLDKYNYATTNKLSQLVTNACPMHSEDNPDKLKFNDMKDTYDIVNARSSVINNSYEPGTSLWRHVTSKTWKATFPWSHGTHFIFSDNSKEFDPRLLGPSGFLSMHGSTNEDEGNHKRTGFIT